MDRLTKSVNFLSMENSDLVEKLAVYIKEIVRLHG